LKELPVPVHVLRARDGARGGAADHFVNGFLHQLKRLPVATRRQSVAVAIPRVPFRIPVSLPHALD